METGVVGASGAGKWVRRRGCQAPHSNHHRHRHLFVIVAVTFFVITIITIFHHHLPCHRLLPCRRQNACTVHNPHPHTVTKLGPLTPTIITVTITSNTRLFRINQWKLGHKIWERKQKHNKFEQALSSSSEEKVRNYVVSCNIALKHCYNHECFSTRWPSLKVSWE